MQKSRSVCNLHTEIHMLSSIYPLMIGEKQNETGYRIRAAAIFLIVQTNLSFKNAGTSIF